MRNDPRLSVPSLLVSALVIATTGPMAWSQNPIGGDLLEAEDVVVPQPVRMAVLNDNIIDQWLFNGVNNVNNSSRSRFESLLKLQVADVGRTCGASEAQQKKLELAGRGDIKRFFDSIEEVKRKHTPLKNDAVVINQVNQEIQPLRLSVSSGPFGESSLFAKTLRKILTEEQAARYAAEVRERKLFRHRAKIDLLIKQIDHALGLSAAQRERFSELLVEQTRPARIAGPYDTQVLMLQVAKLPESQLKPILDDAQRRTLSQILDQVKLMEVFLDRNGYVPDPDPVGPATK
jgi:hypothetical protein